MHANRALSSWARQLPGITGPCPFAPGSAPPRFDMRAIGARAPPGRLLDIDLVHVSTTNVEDPLDIVQLRGQLGDRAPTTQL